MRTTKAQIQSELEAARAANDLLRQQNLALSEEKEMLRRGVAYRDVTIEQLRNEVASIEEPKLEELKANILPAKARLQIMKRLAVTLRCQIKWLDAVGFSYFNQDDRSWYVVPSHSLDFVTKSLGAEFQA